MSTLIDGLGAVKPDVVPISYEEMWAVRNAVEHRSTYCVTSDFDVIHVWGATWRAQLPPELPIPESAGDRLVEAYIRAYSSLEADGDITGWGGIESKNILTDLVFEFPLSQSERCDAMRAALDAFDVAKGHVR